MNNSKDNSLLSIPLFLLLFIVCNHFLMMISFLSSSIFLPIIFPLSLLISLGIQFLFLTRQKISLGKIITYQVLCLCLVLVSFCLSLFYFDLSWDGQWYHQPAICALKEGWNPLTDPFQIFNNHKDNSIRHFPKNSWFYASAFYSMSGLLEGGKSINYLYLFASAIFLYSTLIETNFSKYYSILITLIICLNPVVSSEITTYLVDGNLYLLLVIYLSSVVLFFYTYSHLALYIGSLATISLLNSKQALFFF